MDRPGSSGAEHGVVEVLELAALELGLGEAEAVAEGEPDELADTDGDVDADAEGDADADGDVLGQLVGEGAGDAEDDASGDEVGEADGEPDGVGVCPSPGVIRNEARRAARTTVAPRRATILFDRTRRAVVRGM